MTFLATELKIGFMEHPDIPSNLACCKAKGVEIDVDDVTYYVGSETIVPAEDGKGLPRWQEALFVAMGRNAARMSDYLQLPYDQVVAIGREIENLGHAAPQWSGSPPGSCVWDRRQIRFRARKFDLVAVPDHRKQAWTAPIRTIKNNPQTKIRKLSLKNEAHWPQKGSCSSFLLRCPKAFRTAVRKVPIAQETHIKIAKPTPTPRKTLTGSDPNIIVPKIIATRKAITHPMCETIRQRALRLETREIKVGPRLGYISRQLRTAPTASEKNQ